MNRFPFAPGVVTGGRNWLPGNTRQRRELWRWAKAAALWVAVSAAAGALVGYVAGWFA